MKLNILTEKEKNLIGSVKPNNNSHDIFQSSSIKQVLVTQDAHSRVL